MTGRHQGSFEADLGGVPFESGIESITGTATASLGALIAAVTGVRSTFGTVTAPLGTITADATGASGQIGTGDAPLGTLTGSAIGVRTVIAVVVAPLGVLTGSATGNVIRIGAGAAPLGSLSTFVLGEVMSPKVGTAYAHFDPMTNSAVAQGEHFGSVAAPFGRLVARLNVPSPPLPEQVSAIRQRFDAASGSNNGLGCGVYEVYFKTRGGDSFVCRARNITSLSYTRTLNEISDAKITIALNGQDKECCACIGAINPWEHEIAVYRDGEEVWCGPVVNADIDLDTLVASFECRDLLYWADKRWIELAGEEYDVEEIELAELWNWVLSHGYNKDPWNMEWYLNPTGIPIAEKFYPAYSTGERWGGSYPNVGEELRTLSKSGIDFTVIRRTLFGGDLETNPPISLPPLFDNHWTKLPKLSIVGGTMATEVAVAGGNGGYYGWDDDQMWIERPQDEYRERFGLLQQILTEPTLDEEDTYVMPNAIAQEAFGLRELKKQPYAYITGGVLAPSAPFNFNSLIPGATLSVALTQTCRPIEDEYRLYQVDVEYRDGTEKVSLQLTPKGVVALRT